MKIKVKILVYSSIIFLALISSIILIVYKWITTDKIENLDLTSKTLYI